MRNYLKNLAIHLRGDYPSICRFIHEGRNVPSYDYQGNYICYGDRAYPSSFYELDCPPFVIFYEGNLSFLNEQCIAVIGSRTPIEYALRMTEAFVGNVREHYTIVSGLAYGIDITAHRAALDFQSIAVVGCGLDICYPSKHRVEFEFMKKNHLVISEYPKGVHPHKHYFPFRNRLIAALSQSVYVMSAFVRSGTMHTVNEALKLNRRVICLPHNLDDITGAGCNLLIQEGAEVLTNLEDLSNI
ncbi:DNA-processing protein DprA [Erysipelothrix rhusiopathiae]|nr:DNA-processing protein DprA [Erysipelothrix rhusiopathiae]